MLELPASPSPREVIPRGRSPGRAPVVQCPRVSGKARRTNEAIGTIPHAGPGKPAVGRSSTTASISRPLASAGLPAGQYCLGAGGHLVVNAVHSGDSEGRKRLGTLATPADRARTDRAAQLEELPTNALCPPGRILESHPPDEGSHLRGESRSPEPGSGPPPPVEAPTSAVPGYHCLGSHHDKLSLPRARTESTDPKPQNSVPIS